MNELARRIVTGIGLVALVMIGTLINTHIFFIVFGAIGLMCSIEYTNIVLIDDKTSSLKIVRKIYGILLISFPLIWMYFRYIAPEWSNDVQFLMIYFVLFQFFILLELINNKTKPFKNLTYFAYGIFYIGIPFGLLAYLALFLQEQFGIYYTAFEIGPVMVLGVVILVYSNDSWAYVFGRWLGKRPFAPRISPKKTWEGVIGGGVLTILTSCIYPVLFFPEGTTTLDWIVVASLISVFGVLGDLAESMLKRSFELKDSTDAINVSLLPGHGGFLDRYDSLVFVVPFITMYFVLVYM